MTLEIISRYPGTNRHQVPLLFIHGALHGAWCWDVHFLDYFAQHGYALACRQPAWTRQQRRARRFALGSDRRKPDNVGTPLLVLGAERDNMLSPEEIEATAKAYNTRAHIIPGVAHNSMLEVGWRNVADRILGWLDEHHGLNASVTGGVSAATAADAGPRTTVV